MANPKGSEAKSSLGPEVRKRKYISLLEQIDNLGDAYSSTFSNDSITILKQSSELIHDGTPEERVLYPNEQVLSSTVILNATTNIKSCVGNVQGITNVYNSNDLADHIKNNRSFWNTFNSDYSKRVPSWHILNGVISDTPNEEKTRKTYNRSIVHRVGHETQPENIVVDKPTVVSVEKMTKVSKVIFKVYKNNGRKPINFYEAVIDPNSYAQSIENIFHFAFAVKDGQMSLTIGVSDDDIPYITPMTKDQRTDLKNQPVKAYKHFILKLTMDQWKEAVDVFKIKDAMIRY